MKVFLFRNFPSRLYHKDEIITDV